MGLLVCLWHDCKWSEMRLQGGWKLGVEQCLAVGGRNGISGKFCYSFLWGVVGIPFRWENIHKMIWDYSLNRKSLDPYGCPLKGMDGFGATTFEIWNAKMAHQYWKSQNTLEAPLINTAVGSQNVCFEDQ